MTDRGGPARALWLLLGLLVAAACGRAGGELPAAAAAGADPALQRVTLLLTTDEHGWLEPFSDVAAGVARGGVIELRRQLRQEGLGSPDVVLLSSGDMWTGPYESTLLEGQPMLAAFNRIGYRAAVIGNHDFDFGLATLARRSAEAQFPLLAANLVDRASGERPPWAAGSTVLDAGGLRLGLVGLTHLYTPRLTDPRNVSSLEFLPYAPALRREVPRLRERHADQVVSLFHVELDTVRELLPTLRELGVVAAGVGHAHRAEALIDDNGTPDDVRDDVVLCNAGPYLRSYCRIDLAFRNGELVERAVTIREVSRPLAEDPLAADPELLAIIEDARARLGELGSEWLTELDRTIEVAELRRLLVDSWLRALPGVRFAVTNDGGIRQPLLPGSIRVRDVISALPFDNTLVVVELSGRQLREVLANPASVVGGFRYRYRETPHGREVLALFDRDGSPIPDETRLRIVINDFMYLGGDGYAFAGHDPAPEWTAIDWREPLVQWLRDVGRGTEPLPTAPEARARNVDRP